MVSKGVQIFIIYYNTARHIRAKNHMKLPSTTPKTIKAYLIYSFYWIKMQTKTEDVYVTKVVGQQGFQNIWIYIFLIFL